MKKLIFLTLLFFFSSNLYAGISVFPARNEIHIDNDSIHDGKYVVVNDNDDTIVLSITCEKWYNSQENADIQVGDWLSISNKQLVLAPHERVEIDYKVYSKSYTGSLSAMLSFSYNAPKMTGINLMTSVPVYLTIKGTEKVAFEITNLSMANPRMFKEEGIPVTFTVKNNGNLPVRLQGSLTIKKGKKTISEKPIGEQSPVYAGLDRIFVEKFQPPQAGKYVLSISLNAFNISVEKSIQFRVNKFGEISF